MRVVGLREDPRDRRVGRWVRTDYAHKLEVNDEMEAVRDFRDATEESRLITKGTICIFRGWGANGDALVACGRRSTVALVHEFEESTTLR